jgi:hypothetical protein
MKKIVAAMICSTVFLSCKEPKLKIAPPSYESNFFDDEKNIFDFKLDDSTVLAYLSSKAFDTTLMMILTANGPFIKGKIFFYPPTFYLDYPYIKEYNCMSYKGINFRIRKSKWDSLSYEMKVIIKSITKGKDDLYGKIHPRTFKIYFNSNNYTNPEYSDSTFSKIRSILYKNILSDLLENYPETTK